MWTITHLPPRKKTLECKWVYKVRHNTDGTWERYKARLVTLRNHQIKWVDYDETFAPIVKMVIIQTVLTVVVVKNWELHEIDVHNSFLQGALKRNCL